MEYVNPSQRVDTNGKTVLKANKPNTGKVPKAHPSAKIPRLPNIS